MEWLTGTAALVAAITGLLSAVSGLVGYRAGKAAALKIRDERPRRVSEPVQGEVSIDGREDTAE